MKKWVGLFTVLCVSASLFAVPDIEFSPGGTAPGGWYYSGTGANQGVFSFKQMIDIDAVKGATTDALYDQFIFLPDLTLVSYTPGMFPGTGTGVISSGGLVEIKDGNGNVLLSGNLTGGNFMAVFAASVIYPEIAMDIDITSINNTIGSALLASINDSYFLDLNLSLQWSANFDTIIQKGGKGNNGFSGSMTSIVPEPATMVLLGLGALLLGRKK